MKSSYLRLGAGLLLALALAACGGGKETFAVKGTFGVNGVGLLTNEGLVLGNGSDRVTVPAGATSFVFPNRIEYGDEFTITQITPPNHMNCIQYSGTTGSAGHNLEIAAVFTCSQNTWGLSGTVTGLTAGNLVIGNGSDSTVTLASGTTTITMANVADGTSYGLTVLTQPTGLTCTIANGTGIMGGAAVTNVAVTCVPNT